MILLYVFLFSGSLQGNSWEVEGHTIRQTALRWAVLIGVSLRVSRLTQPLTFAPLHPLNFPKPRSIKPLPISASRRRVYGVLVLEPPTPDDLPSSSDKPYKP